MLFLLKFASITAIFFGAIYFIASLASGSFKLNDWSETCRVISAAVALGIFIMIIKAIAQ